MNALRLGLALALAFLLTAPAGCIGPDRSLPPPLEPVVPKERVSVALPPTRNESPLAVVADFTAETNRMLGAVLTRTGRFTPDADAGFRLETAITSVRDEDASETVIHGDASRTGLRRRAVVEMRYRLADASGRTLLDGVVEGDHVALGGAPLPPPDRAALDTGAFWNSPLGLATRECLDAIVRHLAETA